MASRFANESSFYCIKCGKKGIPVLRKKGKEREAGHLKKLYCIHCQQEINHVECKPFTYYTYEDFLLERENGNFDEHQNRIMPFGLFKDRMVKEGVLTYE